jgi:trehalose 6-phosphate synthase/phosphatase
LLDYDGTLAPIVSNPSDAAPSSELLSILNNLSLDERNLIYIITGRDRMTMQRWLGNLRIGLSCEHGAFFLPKKSIPQQQRRVQSWRDIREHLEMTWKSKVMNIIDRYAHETAGCVMEVKEITVVWHYRNAVDPEFALKQKEKLLMELKGKLDERSIEIVDGKKVIEVRPKQANKGQVVQTILEYHADADFVLCMGDDTTDEDMFRTLNQQNRANLFTVVVERKPSVAHFYVQNQSKVIELLKCLQ